MEKDLEPQHVMITPSLVQAQDWETSNTNGKYNQHVAYGQATGASETVLEIRDFMETPL